ncbi:MAG: hypothetical protein DLM59_05900 [Pseudonocardiales bacterium]|nr:MAG: hypothetical protein DLM59_05900 [Pseudonocardiales bacterium]
MSPKTLLDAGAQVRQEVKDGGGDELVATVQDADGNMIGLIQPALKRAGLFLPYPARRGLPRQHARERASRRNR